MKLVPLVWAMVWRSRVRTTLTFLAVVIAFVLFGLLGAVQTALETGVRIAGADRLVVQSKLGLNVSLSLAQRSQMEAIPGVKAVFPELWFAGCYQDPKQVLTAVALDIKTGYARLQ